MAEDQLGIHILGPTYFGTRQVGLKPDKKINTPADMAGIKLRMPGGEAWQFLGTGARRQPDADGLCRGLYRPADRRDRRPGQPAAERREHEVLRGDVADRADLAPRRLSTCSWSRRRSGTRCRRTSSRRSQAADDAIAWSTAEHLEARGGAGRRSSRSKGLKIYTPDVDAFRAMPRRCISTRPGQGLARGHARPHQRALSRVGAPPDGGRGLRNGSGMTDDRPVNGRRQRWARGCARRAENVRGDPARGHVRRLHPPDRLPLPAQPAGRLDRRS